MGPWLDGMARRKEQIELNRGGSCAEVCTHDALGALRGHGATTELTARGTEGSNPSSSTGESAANLISSMLGNNLLKVVSIKFRRNGPGQDRGRGQLGAIVGDDTARPAMHGDDLVQLVGDPPARDRPVRHQPQAFACAVVDDRQRARSRATSAGLVRAAAASASEPRRYSYVAPHTRTHASVGVIGSLEIDFTEGKISQVGDQYGIGRR
jgi:hypothetical protein